MGCINSVRPVNSPDYDLHQACNLLKVQELTDDQTHVKENTSGNEDTIAIVGIGCKTPGAENAREFWRLLLKGENHICDIPSSRWNADAFFDKNPEAPGKYYVKKAGFIKNAEEFDSGVFGINDFEASSMDPQQRFVLECTHMALQDAGFTRAQISGTNTAVYIGAMNADHRGLFGACTSKVDNYTATGNSNSILAARVSYLYNLLGPCLVVDTACSSSLVSVHLGCQSIRNRECDMAICGGVNYMASPDMFVHLSKAHMLSPTGQCHAFSEDADGYTRGEGCGIIVLKRFREAIRDADKVWATIVTGINQDGHTVTPMTAPSSVQQEALLRQTYEKFRVDPTKVRYIEAHGTGTQAGDPVEVNSLGTFFKTAAVPRNRYIGSVKTNIGHLESAAGVIGIIKIVLMMKHNIIVPSLHCKVLNPKLNFTDFKFTIPQTAVEWVDNEKVACCNSFGFGGTNCHAILASFRIKRSALKYCMMKEKACLVCFSANTRSSLQATIRDLYMDKSVIDLNVQDISYTSTVRRDHYPYRLALIADSAQLLLNSVAERLATDDIPSAAKRRPNIAFVFGGMGTEWTGMCQGMMKEYPVFKTAMHNIDRLLCRHVTWSLIDRLKDEASLQDLEFTPIAIFACQVSLAALWLSLGIRPDCILGQSVGEIAAAHVAGCLNLSDAIQVMFFRSKYLAKVSGGKMIVLKNTDVHLVKQLLEAYSGKASVSLEYSPVSCAVSGDVSTIDEVRRKVMQLALTEEHSLQVIELKVSVAYHSKHVDPCKEQFAKSIAGLSAKSPAIPFISTVIGDILTTAPDVTYWVDHMRCPVLFSQAMQRAYKFKDRIVFLEIGPKPVLSSHIADILPDAKIPVIVSMSKQPEHVVFLTAVASLYQLGVDPLFQHLPTGNNKQITDVPRYVFEKTIHKTRTEISVLSFSGAENTGNNHPFVYPVKGTHLYKIVFTPLGCRFVYDHKISEKIVIPGIVYAEAGFAINNHLSKDITSQAVVSVRFENLVSTRADELVEMLVTPSKMSSTISTSRFSVLKDNKCIAHISLELAHIVDWKPEVLNLEHIFKRCTEQMDKKAIYCALNKLGFSYGEPFSLLEDAHRSDSEAIVFLKVSPGVYQESKAMTIHPCILDCMLQSSVVIAQENKKNIIQILPDSIHGLRVYSKIEEFMFVYAALKAIRPKQSEYNIQLLSKKGEVIAEMDGLVVKRLTEQRHNDLQRFFTVKWTYVGKLQTVHDISNTKATFILTNMNLGMSSKRQTVFNIDDSGWEANHFELASVIKDMNNFQALILLLEIKFAEHIDGNCLNLLLLHICGLIQTVFRLANEYSISVPIFIITLDAWALGANYSHTPVVNPASTALWGLLRTMLAENIYPLMWAIDLHTPSLRLTPEYVDYVVRHFIQAEELFDEREVIVAKDKAYVNRICQIDPNTIIPEYRDIAADPGTHFVLMSTHSDSFLPSVGVRLRYSAIMQELTFIKSHEFGQPSHELMTMKMTDKQNAVNIYKYAVTALETIGEEGSDPVKHVVTCCPVHVGNRVLVPPGTLMPTSALPDYQLGDLTKLVILWALTCKVSSKHVTVLTSSASQGLGEVMKLMLEGHHGIQSVSIVNLQSLNSTDGLDETIISLLYIDSSIMLYMASKWQKVRKIIALSVMFTHEAVNVVNFSLPHSEVCLVDTQQLFSPFNLSTLVPAVNEWLLSHPREITATVADVLHAFGKDENQNGEERDPTVRLLQMRSLVIGNVRIKVSKDHLFTKESAYIVVGGLSGLGWIFVLYLAQHGAGNVAIFQRRKPSEEHLKRINEVSSQYQCKFLTVQCDVTNMVSLEKGFTQMSEEFSHVPLKGVFFGAAVVLDGHFFQQTQTTFNSALSPKVKGAWNMHLLTRSLSLDFFVLHSSAASVMGNQGQTNYATGNSFLDGLAHYRRSLGLPAQTLNWGALDTGLLENQADVRHKLESRGFLLMTQAEIEAIITPLLMLNWIQILPIKFDLQQLSQMLHRSQFKPLLTRMQKIIAVDKKLPSVEMFLADLHLAKTMEPPARIEIYTKYLIKLACIILSVESSAMTRDTRLVDLGLDSVSSLMIVNQIYRDLMLRLPLVIFLTGDATVSKIAQALSEMTEKS